MAKQGVDVAVALVLVVVLAAFPAVHSIGVCNGVLGNDLPAPSEVVKLYQSKRIDAMRIYEPESNVLKALSGTGIAVLMDVGKALPSLASSRSAAAAWVKANVSAFPGVSFRYIAVGNEVIDSAGQKTILPAMRNVQQALAAAGLGGTVKVSTSVRFDVFNNTSPPSNGVLADKSEFMRPILNFLASTGAPLLANVYPYFAYKDHPQDIQLDFATFVPGSTTVNDKGLTYTNLFDAMVDSIYAALEKAGTPGLKVVISESGWPSDKGFGATAQNAQTYNQRLIKHVGNGTPKRPGPLEAYIFAMFNENLKDGDEIEKHFGLFKPDKTPAYDITF